MALHARLARYDQEIACHAHAHAGAKRMKEIVGIGTLTASAAAATVVDAKGFRCGRQFAPWLGLVPRQMSSGGKSVEPG